MPRPLHTSVLSFLFLVTCLAESSAAATIRGTVTDPDGAVVAGARVVLSSPVGTVATSGTDSSGAFVFSDLPAGDYDVRVALSGFRAEPARAVVTADEDHGVAITLALAAVSEQVLVSASQIDMPLSRTPDSVTVLTAEDLRVRQIVDLPSALRLVPGLAVAQYGSRGTLASVFPRGGESDFTLVLVDGIRVNTFGGGFDFGQLPMANVERIEVVRGPQSALYGSDAIGAVVQIVTRRGGAPAVEGLVEGGSFGTNRLAVSSAGSIDRWDWGVGAERLSTDGFTGRAANGEQVSNDDFSTRQATLAGGWRPSAGTHVRGEARFATDERGSPGPYGSDPGGTFGGVDTISRGTNDTTLFSVAAVHAWTPRLSQRAEVTYGDLDSTFLSPFGESDSQTRRWSGRVQADAAIAPALSASFGMEAQHERADNTFITDDRFEPVPVRRRVLGYFAEARIQRHERLFLTAGVRLERIRRAALAANTGGGRPAFAIDSVTSANPKIAAGWFVQPPARRTGGWTRLHGSAGTGIRPPTASEIAFTDNPDLKPERSRSFDAGVEQAFEGGAVMLDATVFSNRYDDLIVAVGRDALNSSRFLTDNIANARARGLELSAAARTRTGIDARFSYTRLATGILDLDRAPGLAPAPFSVGDRLIRRPRHQAVIDVAYTRGRLTAFAQVARRGSVLDIDPSFGASAGLFEAPGFAVTHTGATVRLVRGAELFGRIMNLFDRDYEEALGYPAPGRSAYVGVRLAASR